MQASWRSSSEDVTRRRDERGATMVEAALLGAILVIGLTSAILYMQGSTEKRVNTGRSTFGCAEMCDPGTEHCACDNATGDCACAPN